jgi:hypothetical protein
MLASMTSLGANAAGSASHWALTNAAHAVGPYLLTVAAAVLGTYIYSRFFRARQEFAVERSIRRARRRADRLTPAAEVSVALPLIPWSSWLSDEMIELAPGADPGKSFNYFPGHSLAVTASRPYRANGAEQVTSRLSFDLKGTHHTDTPITRIRAVIDARRPVPSGTVFYAAPQGTTQREGLAFDLGSSDLDAKVPDGEYGTPTARRYLAGRSVSMEMDKCVGFVAQIFAPLYDYEILYHLEITFAAGPPITIDDNGKSFRIVGYPSSARRAYFSPTQGYRVWSNYPDLINAP